MFAFFKKHRKKKSDWVLLNLDNSEFNFVGFCKAYYQGKHVIDLAEHSTLGNKFVISHFASVLNDQLEVKFKGMGEPFLRYLAQQISLKYPHFTDIEIELHRTITSVKDCPKRLKSVRDARENLLRRIGAQNITVKFIPEHKCYEVRGTWNQKNW